MNRRAVCAVHGTVRSKKWAIVWMLDGRVLVFLVGLMGIQEGASGASDRLALRSFRFPCEFYINRYPVAEA